MAKQTIDIGTIPNDGTGDPWRTAWGKCNSNFDELYAAMITELGDIGNVELSGTTDGQVLTYNASSQVWYPSTPADPGIDGIVVAEDGSTVVATCLAINFTGSGVAVADSGSGVATVTISGGGGGGSVDSLDDIGDVDTSGAADGYVLTWDHSNGVWYAAEPPAGGGGDGSGGVDVENDGSPVGSATVLNFVGATVTDAGGGQIDVEFDLASLAAEGWETIHASSPSGAPSVDVADLGDYDELLIIARNLTATNSGVRRVQVSTDNGSSFDSTAANYQIVSAAGTEGNAATPAVAYHSTNTTAARTIIAHVKNTKGAVKCVTSVAGEIEYVGSADPINAVRVDSHNGGTISGGPVYVLGRKAGGGGALDDLSDVDAPSPLDGQVLTWDESNQAWYPAEPSEGGAGDAFPATPWVGQRFFRIDRGIEYYWDGTRWLSVHLHQLRMLHTAGVTADAVNDFTPVPYKDIYDLWLERLQVSMLLTAGTASWNWSLRYRNSANAGTDIATCSAVSPAANTWINYSTDINALLNSAALVLENSFDEISGAAAMHGGATLYYRLVG